MKKLFAVMLVAAAMTSCTDNTKTEESTRSADSVTVAPAPAAQDTMPAMSTDTTKAKM